MNDSFQSVIGDKRGSLRSLLELMSQWQTYVETIPEHTNWLAVSQDEELRKAVLELQNDILQVRTEYNLPPLCETDFTYDISTAREEVLISVRLWGMLIGSAISSRNRQPEPQYNINMHFDAEQDRTSGLGMSAGEKWEQIGWLYNKRTFKTVFRHIVQDYLHFIQDMT
jgi:hypothetical protein